MAVFASRKAPKVSGGGGDGGSNFPASPWVGAPTGAVDGADDSSAGVPGAAVSGAAREACEALHFDARLRNVDAAELAMVAEGDTLVVVYREAPARMVAVSRRLPDGSPAPTAVGALLDRLQELLPCLAVLEFEAEVTRLDGGNTRVHVRPATA